MKKTSYEELMMRRNLLLSRTDKENEKIVNKIERKMRKLNDR